MSVDDTLDEVIGQLEGINREKTKALTQYHGNLRELKELLQCRLISHEVYTRDRKVVIGVYAQSIQQLLERERILKHQLDVTSSISAPRSSTFRQYALALN